MKKEVLIYGIYEELAQSASEANLGRLLTEKELKRLFCVMSDQDFSGVVYSALVNAIEEAVKEDDWVEYDKRYEDTTLEELV